MNRVQKHPALYKAVLLLLCVCIICSLSACKQSEAAKAVDDLISEIGEVTLDSGDSITQAEDALASLEERDLKQVKYEETLTEARTTYDALVKAYNVTKVQNFIDEIGVVSLDNDSRTAISIARKAYDQSTEDVQNEINNYNVLTEAEAQLSKLKIEEVADSIANIGEVSLDSESAISEARKAYMALSTNEKGRVSNIDTLRRAESKYDELLKEAEKQAELEEARSLIRVKRIWVSKPDSAGGVELYFNFTNNSDKVIKYITFGATFYNAVGDVVTCKYKRDVINYCSDTGPYAKGEGLSGSGWYWGDYYNWDIKSVKLVYLSIEYMDGTEYAFSNDQIEAIQY